MAAQVWLETDSGACSSLVTHADPEGASRSSPFIIRTMDWELDEMRACTFQVKFARRGRVCYVATTHAGYVGFITGSSTSVAVSVNWRRGDDIIGGLEVRQLAPLKRLESGVLLGHAPISYAVRHLLENMGRYDEAVAFAESVSLMAPCYFTVAGTAAGEGCVITRAQTTAQQLPVWLLGSDGPTCQTNDDIFKEDDGWVSTANTSKPWAREAGAKHGSHSCPRRKLGEKAISDAKISSSPTQLWQLMNTSPIRNPGTIFTTAMCPVAGYYVSALGAVPEKSVTSKCSTEGCDFLATPEMNDLCESCYIKSALG
jgi:hypothetical protein